MLGALPRRRGARLGLVCGLAAVLSGCPRPEPGPADAGPGAPPPGVLSVDEASRRGWASRPGRPPPFELEDARGARLGLERLALEARVEPPWTWTEVELEARTRPGDRARLVARVPAGARLARVAVRREEAWVDGRPAPVVEPDRAPFAAPLPPALDDADARLELRLPADAEGRLVVRLAWHAPLDRCGAPYRAPLAGLGAIGRLSVRVDVPEHPDPAWRRAEDLSLGRVPLEDLVVPLPCAGPVGLHGPSEVAAFAPPPAPSAGPDFGVGAVDAGWLLLVDQSASMRAEQAALAAQLDAWVAARRAAAPDAPLAVVGFDQEVVPLYVGTAAGFGPSARTALRGRRALGATDLGLALTVSAALARDGRYRRVLVWTDGRGTTGPRSLEAAARRLTAAGVTRVDLLVPGGSSAAPGLHAATLAEAGGWAVHDARLGLDAIAEALAAPTAPPDPRWTAGPARRGGPRRAWGWMQTETAPDALAGPLGARLVRGSAGLLDAIDARADAPPPSVLRWRFDDAGAEPAGQVPEWTPDGVRLRAARAGGRLDAEAWLWTGAPAEPERIEAELAAAGRAPPPPSPPPPSPPTRRARTPRPRPPPPPEPGPPPARRRRIDWTDAHAHGGGQDIELLRALFAQVDAFETCEGPPGSVSIRLTVEADGRVLGASATGGAERLRDCLAGVARRMVFHAGGERTELHGVLQVLPARPAAPTPSPTARPGPPPAVPPLARARPRARPRVEPAAAGPFGHWREVRRLVAEARLDEARAAAWAAYDAAPGEPLGLILLGELLGRVGDRAEAARAWGSLIELYGDRADLLRHAAARLQTLGDPRATQLGLDALARARARRPDLPAGHRAYALALLGRGHPKEAFGVLAEALANPRVDRSGPGVERALREELGLAARAWARLEPESETEIDAARRRLGGVAAERPSLRFGLSWDAPGAEADLEIRGADGGEGARLGDARRGPGLELFTEIAGAGGFAFPYRLGVRHGPPGAAWALGAVDVVQHDGRGDLRLESRPFVVGPEGGRVELGGLDAALGPR